MLREVLAHLALAPGQTVVDGTVGAGGHSRAILQHIGPEGTLIGLDRDSMMLRIARSVLTSNNVILRKASYAELDHVLSELGRTTVDRILLDLGLSSDQLAEGSRGFAFDAEGPLDLRFDPSAGEPAWEMLLRLDEDDLVRLLVEYGEERFARQIAREIASRRASRPIRTARDLTEAVEAALPNRIRRMSRKHPASRVFQALRIRVNDELGQLQRALSDVLWRCLPTGGRLVVISFHSLEDRTVKQEFRGAKRWRHLTPKPVRPSPAETRINPRSRSARLRAAEKT